MTQKDSLNLDIQGYSCEHLFGNKSAGAKKGRFSGGISLYYKNCLNGKIKVLEKSKTGIKWIKISKDIFFFDEDVYIGVTYIPPSGSKVLNSQDIDIFEQLELDIAKYKQFGQKVFLLGDMNSRSANESDCLDFDRYLDDEDTFLNDIILQPRVDSDHVLDTHGRRLLLLCQTSGLFIANGRVHEDRSIGAHTFMSLNGMSTVDYLIANPSDLKSLSNFKILNFNEFSDHAPVFLSLPRNLSRKPAPKQAARTELKIVYDESKAALFRSELMNNNEALQRLNSCVDSSPVDSVVNLFTEYFFCYNCTCFWKRNTCRCKRYLKSTTK